MWLRVDSNQPPLVSVSCIENSVSCNLDYKTRKSVYLRVQDIDLIYRSQVLSFNIVFLGGIKAITTYGVLTFSLHYKHVNTIRDL